MMGLTITPFVFRSLTINADNSVSPVPAPGIVVFMLQTVSLLGGGIYLLINKFRHSHGVEKRQLKHVLTGIVISFGLIFFTNFLAVLLFGRSDLIPLGSSYTLFFSGFMAYAIVRHRFLDIRLLVARSVAYLFSLALLTIPYAFSAIVLTRLFFPESELSTPQLIFLIFIAVIFGLTFHPARTAFTLLTRRIFFRDAYDSQLVIDRLSSLLATEIDLQKIVVSSSRLIEGALKPAFIRFAVFKDGETYVDYYERMERKRAVIRPEVDEFDDILIARDEASPKERKFLDTYDAEILLKLRTNEETVGVILLGPKQSGTVYSKQDLDLLTISEKELAIAVQNSRYLEQIQQFNIKLQHEVDEATSELRTTNKKLTTLDAAKDEFISMASHQLRTPLTSVKGYISMVMEGDAGKITAEQKKLLEEAFGSSQRMVYLIADLLNVSRLRTGKFVIEPSEVYLPDVIEEEISQLKPTARSRRLKLKFDKPSRFPKAWLDETKTRQVIMNFIDNAIYYTKAGGEVTIKLIARKDYIEYSVSDTGIGVPKSEQAKLFTKFFRAINARKARPDGTGLGLYMAQRVISAQGGSVIFESEEGKGSKFGFRFPLSSIKSKQHLSRPRRLRKIPAEPDEE